jgi:Ca2+-binding RTX toxin-like protein
MVTMIAALLVAGGVALAETFTCNSTPPCHGTPEGDGIIGTDASETIYAYGGNDGVNSGDGDDTVYGSKGNDDVIGLGGSNTSYGGGGNDVIDVDWSDGVQSTDRSYGGDGNDRVSAVDGEVDIINCGKGTDEVSYDAGIDTIKACEIKHAEEL